MRFGRKCPKGFLPVFSVDTEEEAERLLVMSCSRDMDGSFYSNELAAEQSLERLRAFGKKLATNYDRMKAFDRQKAGGS